MRVGIIGCGLIGKKRALALDSESRLTAVCDVNETQARALGGPEVPAYSDFRQMLSKEQLDAVIVAATHNVLADAVRACLESGCHVLVEKPAARQPEELQSLLDLERSTGRRVRVGFNHRYHPAFRRMREMLAAEDFGAPMFIRGRYGHGGRPGMEKEWRARPELSGGGELIDQGVHLIDLSRALLGDLKLYAGLAANYFWKMPVEDNGFLILRNSDGQCAFLQASCTEWKNLFGFEVYFERAKFEITGLGGSYGLERLSFFRMLPEMGPPETTVFEYPRGDDSWKIEWNLFREDIRLERRPDASLNDAIAALTIVHDTYRFTEERRHT